MKIKELLPLQYHKSISEHILESEIATIVNNTQDITEQSVFFAVQGISSHALDYLTQEQAKMATAIIYEPPYTIRKFTEVKDKFIAIENLHKNIGFLAKNFYQLQFKHSIIGITGTNGKTSVSQFIAQLANYASIGTMGYGRPNNLTPLSHTTPDALTVQKILTELSQESNGNKFDGVAMEVSSHAMSLHRIDAVPIEIAVFTNLTQDHLDFHKDMEDYFQAKAKLFKKESVKTAIINTDDDFGLRLAHDCIANGKKVIAFGQNIRCKEFTHYVCIDTIQLSQRGVRASLTPLLTDNNTDTNTNNSTVTLTSSVWGTFNIYNILASLLALYATGYDFDTLLQKVPHIKGVKGRIESINLNNNCTAIIDYAHTPDALKNTLISLREAMLEGAKTNIKTNNEPVGKIYTVFGCGGDRDKTKRPLMAEVVNQYSDIAIVTDDNPRTEQSQDIIADILKASIDRERFHVIPSRKEAIIFGLSQLSANDVLLIAGKGHEDYQIIGTKKTHFSDHEVVMEWLQ